MSNIIEKIKEIATKNEEIELEVYEEISKEDFKKVLKVIRSLKFKKMSAKLIDSIEYRNYREELRELVYKKRNKILKILYYKEYFRNGIYYYIKYIKLEKMNNLYKEKKEEKRESTDNNDNNTLITFPNAEIFKKVYDNADKQTKEELEQMLKERKLKIL